LAKSKLFLQLDERSGEIKKVDEIIKEYDLHMDPTTERKGVTRKGPSPFLTFGFQYDLKYPFSFFFILVSNVFSFTLLHRGTRNR
jgi:hypothetical protein